MGDTKEPRWLIARTAQALGISPSRVRQLDAELAPEILDGGIRTYDPRRVATVARLRAAAAGTRDATRAARRRFPRPRLVSRAPMAPKESDR